MKRKTLLFAVIAILALPALRAWAGEPTEQLRRSTDRIVKILDDPALKGDAHRAAREAAVREAALAAFDVQESARRSLGPHWRSLTPAQQSEFVKLFADLLERAYVTKIDLYNGERVRYTGDSVDGDHAVVHAQIMTKGRGEVPVDARMIRKGDRWLAYDIVIENVSLVSNYRAQFDRVIRSASYEDLIKRMRKQDQDKAM